jgi:hypothetical protein
MCDFFVRVVATAPSGVATISMYFSFKECRVRDSESWIRASDQLADTEYAPTERSNAEAFKPMRLIREGQEFLARFFLLLLLSGCGEADQGAEQACRSLGARSSVLKIFSDDENNALVTFALKNSSSLDAMMNAAKSEIEKSAISDGAKKAAVYSLGDTILVKSKDNATREVTCIAILSVTVLDTIAEKEIEFRVKQTTDTTPPVSVSPFLFK